jgi:pimeloyl-ACP methyl ester carboxylesterase
MPPHSRSPRPPGVAGPPRTVSGRWLLSAIALTLAAAVFCAYGALCLLFYQGQWQMLFHPSRAITATPDSAGLAFNDVRFDVTDTGKPRLDGWWIPAQETAAATILYLHGARGSLSDCVPALATLHRLGVNVFAIDYQGFGRSAGGHPTERLLDDDAVAAWTYLTDTRHIPASSLVVDGDGVGATLAALLAARFAPAGAVLEDPNPPARQIFLADARARMVPLFLLQKEFLDPAGDLTRANVPRLFLDVHSPAASSRTYQLFALSTYPKQYYDLRRAPADAAPATLRRFLDEILPLKR